jgi:cytochrome c-type biogenesis protein CcmH
MKAPVLAPMPGLMGLLGMMGLLAAATAPPALAVMPDEMLANPVLELRARELSKELRCLVCQNQSIDDSNATLARDLRLVVRERLLAGDSDNQVLAWVADRYGDFALLRPPVKGATLVLWGAPFAVLLAGGAGVALAASRRRAAVAAGTVPLNDDENRRLAALLAGTSKTPSKPPLQSQG